MDNIRTTPLDENELALLNLARQREGAKLAAMLPAWIKKELRNSKPPAQFKFKPGEPPKFPAWVTTTKMLPVVHKIPGSTCGGTEAYIKEFERLNCLASSTQPAQEQEKMATNITKGKTSKTAASTKSAAPASGAEVAATVAAAMRPHTSLDAVVSALTAAVGKVAAEKAQQPKQEKPATPLHKFPAMEEVIGGELLLHNVVKAKALGTGEVVKEQVVMSHDQHGTISLRLVAHHDGYLIGLIDTDKATYCECETYDTLKEANIGWTEWLEAAAY